MRLFLTTLLLFSSASGVGSEECSCTKAGDGVTTRGGSWQVPTTEKKVLKTIRGEVLFSKDHPLDDVLVEVFDNPDALLDLFRPCPDGENCPNSRDLPKKQKRLAACMTGEEGEFCFPDLPPGRYEVRFSKDYFEKSFLIVTLAPEHPRSSSKRLKVFLQAGV
jgi:hypothetical protein